MTRWINEIIERMADIVILLLTMLPETPFNWEMSEEFSQYWGFVNVFIPFPEMITLLTAYVGAVVTWYLLRWALRVTRYIQ